MNEMQPTLYQNYIALSRYARYRPELGRRETWGETVDRLIEFWRKRLGDKVPAKTFDEIRQAIINNEVMPSMRTLMTAGPALERDEVAGYNPVVGSTLVLTREFGMVPISSLQGASATVLNVEGRWASAEFNSFGVQPIKEVEFRLNSNGVRKVECSGNHRWVLADGTVKSTDTLTRGDRVKFVAAPKPEPTTEDYRDGIAHGLVYGDGTSTYAYARHKGYHLRLCGRKTELAKYLERFPVAHPPSFGGEPVYMLYGAFAKTHDLKTLPSPSETDDYLLGFIRGWLATDGSVASNGQVTLSCGPDGAAWFKAHAPRLGFVVTRSKETDTPTNFGERTRSLHTLWISRSSLTVEDLLDPSHKANFRPLDSHFSVRSVVDTGASEEVFCATVDDTNTFVLEGGLVTGNCAYTNCEGVGPELSLWDDKMADLGLTEPVVVKLNTPVAFDCILYVLLCGTGMGFSVERQFVNSLPTVGKRLTRDIYLPTAKNYPKVDFTELSWLDSETNTVQVSDSKYGWASALRILIVELYNGNFGVQYDLSRIRPAGAPLKTFGGRASGPEPLKGVFDYAVQLFMGAEGRKLNSIECHDLVCKIADAVVVGGVRRSALISLSNLSDDRMRHAKSGEWWNTDPQRALANNSVCYTEKPGIGTFMREWESLYESRSGERGIFNRAAAKEQCERIGRDPNHEFGCNPCSEILLRPNQFCNLSEVVVRAADTPDTLRRKVRLAAVLGTWQSTLTDFAYLPPIWRQNCEEERLLGVSLTGVMDHPLLSRVTHETRELLQDLRAEARETNRGWAKILGINPSAAITCVKPSGTVSQLVDAASGLHPRYSEFYIRRVRADAKDPLAITMRDAGFPCEPDVMQPSNLVFSFPVKSPKGAVMRDDRTAIEQLEHWLMMQVNWCDHKPSITVYVREHEWLEVGAWVYKHFDLVSGVSFLPHTDHTYQQAPYEEINEQAYLDLAAKMPGALPLESLREDRDTTTGIREFACAGGTCEI